MNHTPSPVPQTGDGLDEQAIKRAKADAAPRITPEDLQANIVSEHYFTAGQALSGARYVIHDANSKGPLDLLTFCVLVLKNGFTVTGESAVASPANFNADIGKSIARANAVAKMWPLMGYELRSKLAAPATQPPVPAYTWDDIEKMDTRTNPLDDNIHGRVLMKNGSFFSFVVDSDSIPDKWNKQEILNQINTQAKEKHV